MALSDWFRRPGKLALEVDLDERMEIEIAGDVPIKTRLQDRVEVKIDQDLPTRVTFDLENDAFLSGSRVTMLDAIEGAGGMRKIRCVVHVPDRGEVALNVISTMGGTVETTINLNEAKL